MTEKEVILYTRSNCRDTDKVKAFLAQNDVAYFEYDIHHNTTILDMEQFLRRYDGYNRNSFPHMVTTDHRHWQGKCYSGVKSIMESPDVSNRLRK